MENRTHKVVLTADRKLGETQTSMSDLTFDHMVMVKDKILGIMLFIQGDIIWAVEMV